MRVKNGWESFPIFWWEIGKNDWVSYHHPVVSGKKKTPRNRRIRTSARPLAELPFRSHRGAKKVKKKTKVVRPTIELCIFLIFSHLRHFQYQVSYISLVHVINFFGDLSRIPKIPQNSSNSSEVQVQPLTPQVATPVLPAAQRSSANWKMWCFIHLPLLGKAIFVGTFPCPLQGFLLRLLTKMMKTAKENVDTDLYTTHILVI